MACDDHEINATIEKLQKLNIKQLPTVVLIGDKSCGKSSLLESFAGITLQLQGICTRVPLIMRLQNHPNPEPELSLEYNGKVVPTDEEKIGDSISVATEEIAGKGKAISNTPLILTVKKNGVPDLTVVDLPGITRVPVHGQPEDIHDQISEIIMEYITPQDNIILNVLSAGCDFTSCESIMMSKRVDKTGERTLAVVTKGDKYPQGLFDKVNADEVSIGQGYVCVRNQVGDESFEEARDEERKLFESHPELMKMDKGNVGIPILVEKLVKIQAAINDKAAEVESEKAQIRQGSKRTKPKGKGTEKAPVRPPSTRTRRLPGYLKDYVLTSTKKS